MSGSLALHAGAIGFALVRPQLWPWALSAVVADHLFIAAVGLTPRSRLLGPNVTRLPAAARGEVAITIDDGPDPQVTPRVLDLLDEQQASATFFCIGERIVRHAALARDIVNRQHEIGNHSYRHLKRFSLLGPQGMTDEIMRAQLAIAAVTGRTARYFRAPAGLRNPFLEPILAQANLRLVSWTRRGFDTVNANPAVVLERLTRRLAGGDILLLHDGNAARTRAGAPIILEVLPRLLAAVKAAGLAPVTLARALGGAVACAAMAPSDPL